MKHTTPAPCAAELRQQLADVLGHLQNVVDIMADLYDQHPELNDLQPVGFSDVIASSLDEWSANLLTVREQLEVDMENNGSGPNDAPTNDALAYVAATPAEREAAMASLQAFVTNQPDAKHRLEAAVYRRGNKNFRQSLDNFAAGDHPDLTFSTIEYVELWEVALDLGWDPRVPLTRHDSLRAWLRLHNGYQWGILRSAGIARANLVLLLDGLPLHAAGLSQEEYQAVAACAEANGWTRPD